MTRKAAALAMVAAATLVMAGPSAARDMRAKNVQANNAGQCWKSTDGTKPYGDWGKCQPTKTALRIAPPGASNNPNDFYAGARPGYCFKRSDSTKRVGYWEKC
jgi:hypothetical protein